MFGAFAVITIICEAIFYGDILFGFLTSYFDSTIGEFINHPKLIAKHYTAGSFVNDLLATLHWKWICTGVFRMDPRTPRNKQFFTLLKYLKLLKLFDIKKVPHILKSLNQKKETKSFLFIIFYIAMIFIWIHITACFFWYFIRMNKFLVET